MGVDTYPGELNQSSWDKKSAAIDKTRATGLGAELKDLAKLHAAVDWEAFAAAGDTTEALDALDKSHAAEWAKRVKPLISQLKAVDQLASRVSLDLGKDKAIPKTTVQAAIAIARAARDFSDGIETWAAGMQADRDDARKKLSAKAKPGAGDDDDDDESPDGLALGKKLLPLLNGLRSRDKGLPPLAFLAVFQGDEAAVFVGKAVGTPQKKKLVAIKGFKGPVKEATGTCIWEKERVTFVCADAPAGLVKKLGAFLLEVTSKRFKLRLRGLDENAPAEGDGDEPGEGVEVESGKTVEGGKTVETVEAVESVEDESEQEVGPTPAELLRTLAERLKTVRGELETLGAFKSPVGPQLSGLVADIVKLLQGHVTEGVAAKLDQLAQFAKAMAAKKSSGDGVVAEGLVRAVRAEGEALQVEIGKLQAQLAGFKDPALRQPVDDEIQRLERERLAALALGTPEAQQQALQALRGQLPDVADELADALQSDKDKAAWLLAWAPVQGICEQAAQISAMTDIDGMSDDIAYYRQEVDDLNDALADEDWTTAKDSLARAHEGAKFLITAYDGYKTYLKAWGLISADFKAALALADGSDADTTFPAGMVKVFRDADLAVDQQINATEWFLAAQAMPTLGTAASTLLACAQAKEEAMEAFDDLKDERSGAKFAANTLPVPKAEAEAFLKADAAVKASRDACQWSELKAGLPALEKAIEDLQDVMQPGAAFYQAIEDIWDLLIDADDAMKSAPDSLAALVLRYRDADKATKKAGQDQQWDAGLRAVADMESAAQALVDARALIDGDRKPFELAWGQLTQLDIARDISQKAAKAFKPKALADFRAIHQVVNDGRNAGHYSAVIGKLDELQDAIDALVLARDADVAARGLYTQALQSVAGLAAARALFGSTQPGLAEPLKKLAEADTAHQAHADDGAWAEAREAVKALQTAVTAVQHAQAEANQGITPEQAKLRAAALLHLKPATDKALQRPSPAFVETLQVAVVSRLDAVDKALLAKDYLGADAALKALVAATKAMEKAQDDYAAHKLRFETARDGKILAARKLKLGSPTLLKMCNAALDKSARRITDLAAKGKLAKADKAIVDWLAEAAAWSAAGPVYFNLLKPSGAPDRGELDKLAALPGGAKVLDAIVAQLPPDKPQKFMKEALGARFGLTVKQFAKKNPDNVTQLSGLTAIGDEVPDKSLQALYAVLGEVPIANVKGKVTELVRFTEESGGAAYGNKKVYMYCGRADDPKGSTQDFGADDNVIPDGEAIDPDCEPADAAPLPYFRFAALHEVGHAEDDGGGYMKRPEIRNQAGWQKHTADAVADLAAQHFKFDKAYILAMLNDAKSKPPSVVPPPVGGDSQAAAWDEARVKAEAWARVVRESNSPWNKPGVSKLNAINGRVIQESYAGKWVSYDYGARAQGITSYQFRSPAEWFAELYAAYICKKLKKSHPAMSWLKTIKTAP